MRVDVVIVGGGPAGSASAISLSRLGLSVALIDKMQFPRDKCCGDGLTTAALRQLEDLGLDPRSIPSWQVVHHTTWRSHSGYTIDLDLDPADGARIAVARRRELDAALIGLAKAAGVTVLENNALEAVAVESDKVTVLTSRGIAIEAAFAVGADGMWSPLRRLTTDAPRYYGEGHGFRQYFRNVTGVARDRLWVSFEPELLPGYIWSFPTGDGGANVGFAMERREGRSAQYMARVWPELLERPHVKAALGEGATAESAYKSWPLPADIRPALSSTGGGRVLFVGDAARAIDPLTGEGIGQALHTGRLAAESIALHRSEPQKAAAHYRRQVRAGIYIDSGFSKALRLLARTSRGSRAFIRLAPAGPWHGQYALRWVFEDNPRAGLLTPWRWRERFAEKSGAFQ